MEMVQLGRTGVEVSRIGFGGAPAGLTNYLSTYSPSDIAKRAGIIAAIHRAIELGVTYFDTAYAYGDGASEKIFGEALQGHRQKVFIASKVPGWREVDTRQIVETSLKNLRIDTLDLIQIHGTAFTPEDEKRALDSMLPALADLRDEGMVKFIGFTTEDTDPSVYNFIRSGQFDMMQICYNLIFQHPADPVRKSGVIYEAEAQNMGVVTMRTLTSGIFQKWVQWVNPENRFDYSSSLIQFVLSNPMVDVALIGMRSVEEVEKNCTILNDSEHRIDIAKLHDRYT